MQWTMRDFWRGRGLRAVVTVAGCSLKELSWQLRKHGRAVHADAAGPWDVMLQRESGKARGGYSVAGVSPARMGFVWSNIVPRKLEPAEDAE